MATTRWKDKTALGTPASGDRMPITDVDASNTDKYVTPDDIGAFEATQTRTLTNKTIDSASNTLTVDLGEATVTGTAAEFDAALQSDTFIFNSEIGSVVQAHGAVLDDLNTLGAAASDGQFIVATGAGVFAYESGATARTSLGLGSLATQSTINNSDWSGADLAVANGGTGASDAATAFGNLKQAATTSATGVVEEATDAEVRASTDGKFLDAGHLASAAALVALSESGGSVALDWTAGINFSLTLDGDHTISNPLNGIPGTWRTIIMVGNNATDRSPSFGTQFEVSPSLTDVNSTTAYLVSIYCITASRFRAYADEGGDPT